MVKTYLNVTGFSKFTIENTRLVFRFSYGSKKKSKFTIVALPKTTWFSVSTLCLFSWQLVCIVGWNAFRNSWMHVLNIASALSSPFSLGAIFDFQQYAWQLLLIFEVNRKYKFRPLLRLAKACFRHRLRNLFISLVIGDVTLFSFKGKEECQKPKSLNFSYRNSKKYKSRNGSDNAFRIHGGLNNFLS